MNKQLKPDDLHELADAWSVVQRYAPLHKIRNEEDLQRVAALGDLLAENVGADPTHPLYSLFHLVMDLIEQWEDANFSRPDVHPREILRYCMEANDLKPKDLEEIAPEAVLRAILEGQKEIPEEVAKRLAQRFHLNPDAFL